MSLYLAPIPRDVHVEHEALLQAAIGRDPERATTLLAEHILLTFRAIEAIPTEQLNNKLPA
jgi:DNA-binding GntR family transcriptional regulator